MEPDEMRTRRLPLDDATADRLAAGELHPSDAPPGFATVAAALSAARSDPVAAEPDEELLAAMVRAIDDSPSTDRTIRSMRSHLTVKIGALAGAALLSTAGAAAAATGNLPAPAQDAVAGVVRHVGVELPHADDHPENHGGDVATTAHETEPGEDHGRDVSEVARDNRGHDGTTGSTVADDQQEGRGAEHATGTDDNPTTKDDHGGEVSATARDATSGPDHGSAVSETAKDGHGQDNAATSTTVDDRGSGGSGHSGSSDDGRSGHGGG